MTTVRLSFGETAVAAALGLLRYTANRRAGVTDQQVGGQNPVTQDEHGMAAELAVARFLNVYPDLSVDPRKGGHDLYYRGLWLDVKWSHYSNARLLVVASKRADAADIYVLVTGAGGDLLLRGWAWANEIFRLPPSNYFAGYALAQEHLHAMDDLRGLFADYQPAVGAAA